MQTPHVRSGVHAHRLLSTWKIPCTSSVGEGVVHGRRHGNTQVTHTTSRIMEMMIVAILLMGWGGREAGEGGRGVQTLHAVTAK